MSFYRFRRRVQSVITSPGVVLVSGIGSMVLIGIAPVVCAG